jgi:hypothetical protein
LRLTAILLALASALAGCARVQLQAPKEPIVINLNVKIEQEVRVKVDRELEQLLDNEDLFGTETEVQ